MKRTFNSLLACLVVGILFTACDKDDMVIWDFGPAVFAITASENGRDLFDPDVQENREFMDQITVTYDGVEYKPLYGDEIYTRAYLPVWYGLKLGKRSYVEFGVKDGPYALLFGEFDGAEDYDGLTFTVTWPDGKQDEVKYWRTVRKKTSKEPSIKLKILVNGKEIKDPIIHREY